MISVSKIRSMITFFSHLDIFQMLSIPVLIAVLFFSIDFKSSDIVIGAILPLSGQDAFSAQSHQNGLELALRHINSRGGIYGRKLYLNTKDNHDSLDMTAKIARDMVYKDKVTAIIGGFHQDDTRVIQYICEQSEVPFLTAICTYFEITRNGSQYTFRSVTDDLLQFEALAEYSFHKFNVKKPALIYDLDQYGSDSALKFIEIAAKHGQQVCTAVSYRPDTVNFRRQLQIVMASHPDSLVLLTSPKDAAIILRQAREAYFNRPVIGGVSLASTEFIRYSGIHSESTLTTLPFNSRLGGQKADFFLSEYMEEYGVQANAEAAHGYEALMLLALAMRNSGATRESVKVSLSQLHGWESVAGSGGFDTTGNQVKLAEIAIIKEGQIIPINLEGLF